MITVDKEKVEFSGSGAVLITECIGVLAGVTQKLAEEMNLKPEEIVDTILRGLQAHKLLASGMSLNDVKEILK